jgi:small subunit ribosomal protein S1
MPKQKITILKDESNPFDTITYEVDLPRGTKIISKEPYVLDLLKAFGELRIDKGVGETRVEDRVVESKIISISDDQAILEFNGKEDAYLNLRKEKISPEDLQIGSSMLVRVKRGVTGCVEASFADAVTKGKTDEIVGSIGKNVGYMGKVKSLIHGGYYVEIDGINTFMPGSLAGMNKLANFDELVGQEIIVVPVNYSKEREIPVVSHRDYLKTLVPSTIDRVTETIDEWREGKVTGTNKSGIFVEFEDCLTGLITLTELEASREGLLNQTIKPGDSIKFRIKQIISNSKIILTEKEKPYSPWDDAESKYHPEQKTTGKIIKVTNYGIFVELEKGLSGLLHSSQFTKGLVHEEGSSIDVIISKIDSPNRKIVLRKA